ncbi:MAG: hypothetical protein M1820_007942 [Bogoriella megaspora]|nr:MAG: hypothetical protein M1820_007942 [Bogoriella megaspora]
MHASLSLLALGAIVFPAILAAPSHDAHRHLHNLHKRDTFSDKGIESGTNDQSAEGNIWLGDDGDYVVEYSLSPDIEDDKVGLVVWDKNAGGPYTGMGIAGRHPEIALEMSKNSDNKSVSVSFKYGTSAAWGGVYSNTPPTTDPEFPGGHLADTWQETTWSSTGRVDTSTETNTGGHAISGKGPHCGTSMTECVFKCKDPNAKYCGKIVDGVADYELHKCNEGNTKTGEGTTDGGCLAGDPNTEGKPVKWTVVLGP